ncbi:hypothetical protein CS0771_44580 [Catellatospora sp. IY07-71]|uniref:hypothetical protein n=1 Tax=Catellatospora sp. IY07-71 TaxID=2728827 RepID=UPI001BB38A62|nr:hypothetical protein [Catellatospora sp. IY07-71]BCJ74914.1 hypothetical protein CS0771_44580 [Catellatospora sp. IY07-71]
MSIFADEFTATRMMLISVVSSDEMCCDTLTLDQPLFLRPGDRMSFHGVEVVVDRSSGRRERLTGSSGRALQRSRLR